MSKPINEEHLLTTFPYALSGNSKLSALAGITAEALSALSDSQKSLAIYSRIDELDEVMLDILAYDFKIDWWDEQYTAAEKRETLKSCWHVHKRLGTPVAVTKAFEAVYKSVSVKEWWKYGGEPYHFKLVIDSGGNITDYEKQAQMLQLMRFYKNLRSVLDTIEFQNDVHTGIYVGVALHSVQKITMPVNDICSPILTDESLSVLVDENGDILCAERS